MVTAVTGTPILKNIQSTTQCKNQLFTWRLLRLLRILQLHSLRVFSHLWCLAHLSQTRVCFPITAFIDGVHMIWPYPMWNSTKPSADSDHRKCLMWECLIREFKRSFTIRGQCCVLTCAGINQLIKYLSWVQVALLQEEGSKISLFSHSPTYGIAQVCLRARWWAGDTLRYTCLSPGGSQNPDTRTWFCSWAQLSHPLTVYSFWMFLVKTEDKRDHFSASYLLWWSASSSRQSSAPVHLASLWH